MALDVVDAYFHCCAPSRPELYYSWLEPGAKHAYAGEHVERLKGRDHPIEEYIDAAKDLTLVAAVHVEATTGIDDPVKETQWLDEVAERSGLPNAIVGAANLQEPDAQRQIERHLASPRMRGIRHRSDDPDYLVHDNFHQGYALLERYGLASEVSARWPEMAKARDLAANYPNVPMALVRCGFPWDRTPGYFAAWKRGLATLAEAENVSCKITGLVFGDHDWTVESLRPYVLACIEAFGPQRCMFGSHWPFDMLFGTYSALFGAYAEIVADFSVEEQRDMFSRNALRFYRIDAGGEGGPQTP